MALVFFNSGSQEVMLLERSSANISKIFCVDNDESGDSGIWEYGPNPGGIVALGSGCGSVGLGPGVELGESQPCKKPPKAKEMIIKKKTGFFILIPS